MLSHAILTLAATLVAQPAPAHAAPAIVSTDQVRDLVAELLADAESRSSLLADDPGRLPVRIWGFLQFRYVFNHRDDPVPDDQGNDEEGFQSARTRLYFDATPFEGISSRIRTTFGKATGTATLDQAYTTFSLPHDFKVRVGQFGLPLFRDEWVNAHGQLCVNTSMVNTVFNQGQVQGVWLSREWQTFRFWATVSDGVRSGSTDFTSPNESDVALTGRIEWMLAGDNWARFDDYTSFPGSDFATMLGIAGHWETGDRSVNSGDSFDLLYFTADLGLEGDGWNCFASGVITSSNDSTQGWITDAGIIVQGGAFVSDDMELFARYDILLPGDRDPGGEDFSAVTAGFNYYIVPNAQTFKFTANVIYYIGEQQDSFAKPDTSIALLASPSDGQWAIQAQLQLVF
jgi:hypothetical protein